MITKEQALTVSGTLYIIGLYNTDGTAMRVRVNGKCKVWKTRPLEFQLPVKRGLKEFTYITDDNCHLFTTEEPEKINKNEVSTTNNKFKW